MIAAINTPGIFATASLAHRIERAEVTLIEDGATAAMQRVGPEQVFMQRVAGGIAAFTDAGRGCDLAVVTTQPGSTSQQNVQRFGFSLLYARAILVKPAAAS